MFVIIRITQSFLKNINRDEWFIPDWSGDAPWQLRRTGVPVVTARQEISGAVSRRAKRKRDKRDERKGMQMNRWGTGSLWHRGAGRDVSQLPASLFNSAGRQRNGGFLASSFVKGRNPRYDFSTGLCVRPGRLEVFCNWNSIGGVLYKSCFEHYQKTKKQEAILIMLGS